MWIWVLLDRVEMLKPPFLSDQWILVASTSTQELGWTEEGVGLLITSGTQAHKTTQKIGYGGSKKLKMMRTIFAEK
jgi:hypothetical protein